MEHTALNCGLNYYEFEFIGKIIDDFKCLEIIYDSIKKEYFMKLECTVCGNIIFLNKYYMEYGEIKHSPSRCGNFYYENMIGKEFNDITVLKHIGTNNNDLNFFEVQCKKCKRIFNLSIYSILNNDYRHEERCVHLTKGIYSKELINRFRGIKTRCENEDFKDYINIKCLYTCSIDFHDEFIEEFTNHCKIHGIKILQ